MSCCRGELDGVFSGFAVFWSGGSLDASLRAQHEMRTMFMNALAQISSCARDARGPDPQHFLGSSTVVPARERTLHLSYSIEKGIMK